MKNISLGDLKIPITEFASQGNAILGIRDSGKTYTATWLAERLMDAGIPIVVFDPIGIWKYLRVPGKGKGYPVVVAGGENADLPLTPHSAPEIVRAAMRENIPLVIDLFSMELSKADWKRIVETCVRILLYENKKFGLRHIFIEEAAEFAPQRIGPDQGKVYAEIEKLARMGGNAQLGYTLINQRAEEVNKAVLELCDCLFLHRQKGRNSLTALGKWLDIGSVGDAKPIMQSLPMLKQGDCWVWTAGSNEPVRVKIPEKNTFHPDRRALVGSKGTIKDFKGLDVSTFVQQLSGSLSKHLEEAKQADPAELRKQIALLRRDLDTTKKQQPAPEKVIERVEVPVVDEVLFSQLRSWAVSTRKIGEDLLRQGDALAELEKMAREKAQTKPKVTNSPPRVQPAGTPIIRKADPPITPTVREPGLHLLNPQQRILDAIAWFESIGITQPTQVAVAFLANYTYGGGAFNNPRGALRSAGLVEYIGSDRISMTDEGRKYAQFPSTPLTSAELQKHVMDILPAPHQKIMSVILQAYPQELSKEECAAAAGYAPGGAFNNPLGRLRSMGLISYPRPGVVVAESLLFLE